MKTDYSTHHAAAKVTVIGGRQGMQHVNVLVIKVATARDNAPAALQLAQQVVTDAQREYKGQPLVAVMCEPSSTGPVWAMAAVEGKQPPAFLRTARRQIAKKLRVLEASLRYAAVPHFAAPA